MHLPLHVSLPALLLLCAFLLLPPSAADKSPVRAPLDAEINNKRIVNGQEPIDFSSSNYPLHELGFPVGAGAPKLPIPELFPGEALVRSSSNSTLHLPLFSHATN